MEVESFQSRVERARSSGRKETDTPRAKTFRLLTPAAKSDFIARIRAALTRPFSTLNFPLSAFLSSCLIVGFAGRLSAGEPDDFQLLPSVEADSSGLFLNQIVQSDKPVPALRLCDSPAFGKIVVLTRDQIAMYLRDAGSDLEVTNWAGPTSVRVSRRIRAFTQADLLTLLTDTLQKEFVKDRGELELRLTRPWSEVGLPDEPITLKILEMPTSGVTPAFIARFELSTAREGLGTFQVTAQARVWREVWVAHSAIRRGEALIAADVARERRDILSVHQELADFSSQSEQLEFCEPVIANAPILARTLKPRSVIRRGQSVQALLQDGALSITMKVEVLEDGAPGQIIRARNPLSRRDVRGKVLDEQTILIAL